MTTTDVDNRQLIAANRERAARRMVDVVIGGMPVGTYRHLTDLGWNCLAELAGTRTNPSQERRALVCGIFRQIELLIEETGMDRRAARDLIYRLRDVGDAL